MAYTNSPLATYYDLSPNYNPRRAQDKINRITIHHMAGSYGVKECGALFHKKQGSSNYGIDPSLIGCFVEEKNRAWTSSNGENDYRAITIECANTPAGVKNGTWEIAEATYNNLVKLCVDVCHRYGFTRVIEISDEIEKIPYTDPKDRVKKQTAYANNYQVPEGAVLLTQHIYFDTTLCPGPYIRSIWKKLAADIQAGINGQPYVPPAPSPAPAPVPVSPVAAPTLLPGSAGAEVKKLQNNLNTFGYRLDVDGVYGKDTTAAVKGFQTLTKIGADGKYGPQTAAKMREYIK